LPFLWVSGIKEAYKGLLNGDILVGIRVWDSVAYSDKIRIWGENKIKKEREQVENEVWQLSNL